MDTENSKTIVNNHLQALEAQEISQVSGGIAPILAAAVSVAATSTARSFGWAVVSRAAAIYSVYSAAASYGGSGGGSSHAKTGNASNH